MDVSIKKKKKRLNRGWGGYGYTKLVDMSMNMSCAVRTVSFQSTTLRQFRILLLLRTTNHISLRFHCKHNTRFEN